MGVRSEQCKAPGSDHVVTLQDAPHSSPPLTTVCELGQAALPTQAFIRSVEN